MARRRRRAIVAAVAAVAVLTGEAGAAAPYDLSGMVIYNHCKAGFSDVGCQDFLVTMDAAINAMSRLGFLHKFICPPPRATLAQDRLILIRFAEQNPQVLDHNAVDVYLAAEMQAFPCLTAGGSAAP